MGQMNRICEKSTGSEFVVRNITKVIQTLHIALQNLVTSITTLERFQMLGKSHLYIPFDIRLILILLAIAVIPAGRVCETLCGRGAVTCCRLPKKDTSLLLLMLNTKCTP